MSVLSVIEVDPVGVVFEGYVSLKKLYEVAPETAPQEQLAIVSVELQLKEEGVLGGQALVLAFPVFQPEQPPALHDLTWKAYEVPQVKLVFE